jgi:glyoxylase-like metal-dependent hydrolase (beta-lactamase superfamily II)
VPLRELPEIVQLKLATITLPDWHPEAHRTPTCVVNGYAIDHPDGVIVFDTGVGADNDLIDELYEPDLHLLDQALTQAGMELESVIAVVNSHLHFDHCGQNPLLYGAAVPFFIGRTEIDAVHNEPTYTIAEWALPPQTQRHLVDDDVTIADGVTVLAAPGHTAGHLALLVETDVERVVIAGQAAWNVAEFVDEIATPSNVAVDELRPVAVDTMQRIKALEPSKVFFAHCDHYTP